MAQVRPACELVDKVLVKVAAYGLFESVSPTATLTSWCIQLVQQHHERS